MDPPAITNTMISINAAIPHFRSVSLKMLEDLISYVCSRILYLYELSTHQTYLLVFENVSGEAAEFCVFLPTTFSKLYRKEWEGTSEHSRVDPVIIYRMVVYTH